MNEEKVIGYIGDYRIHDSSIKAIVSDEDTIQVSLITEDNEMISAKFVGVKSVESNKAEGMIIYSIVEKEEKSHFRKFVFVNWDEEDDASLEVIAQDCIIK